MPRLRSLATGVVVNLSDEQVAAGLTGFAPVDEAAKPDDKPDDKPAAKATHAKPRAKAPADDKAAADDKG